MKIAVAGALLLSCLVTVDGFHTPCLSSHRVTGAPASMKLKSDDYPNDGGDMEESSSSNRRKFLGVAGSLLAFTTVNPRNANAGIDVSGMREEGSSSGKTMPNSSIANQLKSYDGSASARINEIKSSQPPVSSPSTVSSTAAKANISSGGEESTSAATWAFRANPSFAPSTSKANALGTVYKYTDQIVGPSGSKVKSLGLEFEFPSDWLQLDRNNGGIQYVDQRNGDKLYVLRANLPEGQTLATLPKATIGDLIFESSGSYAKSGQAVEEYKVTSAQTLSECDEKTVCATRRRFKMKFATVTGNGLRVERRSLVDTYQIENTIYMMMTSTNAVKFEKAGPERDTAENIVSSFRVD
mmetsp:Transcript_4796/g.4521  ORF Transcript_4796/g.4521 Transcript_4796/m.4521 type:complete len:355 (-) Transcript_4796:51-1115(-)